MSKIHHTIRNNLFDREYTNKNLIYVDDNNIRHSLNKNKNKNWILLDDPNILQIKYHRDVMSNSKSLAITNRSTGSGAGSYCQYKKGKDYVLVNNKKQNNNFNLTDQRNYIVLSFSANEYPIDRESHIQPVRRYRPKEIYLL